MLGIVIFRKMQKSFDASSGYAVRYRAYREYDRLRVFH
jgi:hypothetical protein